jgi:hypothetical protein
MRIVEVHYRPIGLGWFDLVDNWLSRGCLLAILGADREGTGANPDNAGKNAGCNRSH